MVLAGPFESCLRDGVSLVWMVQKIADFLDQIGIVLKDRNLLANVINRFQPLRSFRQQETTGAGHLKSARLDLVVPGRVCKIQADYGIPHYHRDVLGLN